MMMCIWWVWHYTSQKTLIFALNKEPKQDELFTAILFFLVPLFLEICFQKQQWPIVVNGPSLHYFTFHQYSSGFDGKLLLVFHVTRDKEGMNRTQTVIIAIVKLLRFYCRFYL